MIFGQKCHIRLTVLQIFTFSFYPAFVLGLVWWLPLLFQLLLQLQHFRSLLPTKWAQHFSKKRTYYDEKCQRFDGLKNEGMYVTALPYRVTAGSLEQEAKWHGTIQCRRGRKLVQPNLKRNVHFSIFSQFILISLIQHQMQVTKKQCESFLFWGVGGGLLTTRIINLLKLILPPIKAIFAQKIFSGLQKWEFFHSNESCLPCSLLPSKKSVVRMAASRELSFE